MSELPPSAPFMRLPDDIVLNIFNKLSDDPRNWARLACVSTRISTLIRQVCWKSSCLKLLPSVSADLSNTSFSSLSSTAVTDSASPPGGWASLYKIAVCCPGLLHSGVLLEHSDFGLELDLGPDHLFYDPNSSAADAAIADAAAAEAAAACASYAALHPSQLVASSSTCTWSLYDDLYYDTVYDNSDSPTANMELDDLIAHHHQQLQQQEEQRQQQQHQQQQQQQEQGTAALANPSETAEDEEDDEDDNDEDDDGEDISNGNSNPGMKKKKRKVTRPLCSHLASGAWNLSREHGSKLLASRFRGDTLYICDWPGCVHMEEKRNYMLFRGIFKDFKRSRVWRTINDGHKGKIAVKCAFCDCKDTWDLHSGFCLKRGFGYHDDGEPVVRAYVCDNGHVSGAWTDWPLYN